MAEQNDAALQEQLEEIRAQLAGVLITFDPDRLERKRQAELEQAMSEPGFWDDQERAQKISTEHSRVAKRLAMYQRLQGDYDDAAGLLELEPEMADEIEASIAPLQRELDGSRRRRSSTASTTPATRSSPSSRAPAAPTRRTGRR